MPRSIRIEYAGALYHVMARGNRREPIYLFGDRYKAVLVEGAGYYYETLLDYIHLNPVRAGLVRPQAGGSVLDYPWSSVAGGCALPPGRRPRWLAAADALGAFGCPDTAGGRRKWVERLDRRASQEARESCGVPAPLPEADGRRSHLREGWYLGSQVFAERMLAMGEVVLKRKRHRGARSSGESRADGEQEARRLLAEGLKAAGLRVEELPQLKGSDGRKVAIARVIRRRTTVSMSWLAGHLSMRSAANASQQILRKPKAKETLPKPLKTWINLSGYVA